MFEERLKKDPFFLKMAEDFEQMIASESGMKIDKFMKIFGSYVGCTKRKVLVRIYEHYLTLLKKVRERLIDPCNVAAELLHVSKKFRRFLCPLFERILHGIFSSKYYVSPMNMKSTVITDLSIFVTKGNEICDLEDGEVYMTFFNKKYLWIMMSIDDDTRRYLKHKMTYSDSRKAVPFPMEIVDNETKYKVPIRSYEKSPKSFDLAARIDAEMKNEYNAYQRELRER